MARLPPQWVMLRAQMTRYPGLLLGTSVLLATTLGVAGPFTQNGTQPTLQRQLIKPSNCNGCHGDFDSQHNIEPYPTWAGSMMAQATRDPLFWAALDVANSDVPDVGEFCLRCHTPRGWLAGRSEPPDGSTDGCGLQGDLDQPDGDDFAGVACHFCHRMMINPGPPAGQLGNYLENGQYWLDDGECNNQPCRRGPYDYPADGANPPPHPWQYSAYHESSQLCGTCHNVTSPAHNLIVNGKDSGVPFPIERTYREWLQSAYSATSSSKHATCQNCHMPDATNANAYACNQQNNDHTGDMPVHVFAGGNAWVPEVIRTSYPALGIDSSLTATRNAALDMLQKKSANLELTVPGTVAAGSTLAVSVKVTNLAGHKLPTGYPEGRRMWIELQVLGSDNSVVFDSGAYDAATGVLASDAQLKVYQAQVGIWSSSSGKCEVTDASGKPMFHFALNDCILSDNRIPPAGFTGGTDTETEPVGYTYPETSPGSGVLVNYDVTPYTVPVPATAKSPLTVRATLRYQTTSKEYVDFLQSQAQSKGFPVDCIPRQSGAPTQTRAGILYSMWKSNGKAAPVDMVTQSQSVTVTGTAGTGGTSGAGGTAGAGGAGAAGGSAGSGAGASAGTGGTAGSDAGVAGQAGAGNSSSSSGDKGGCGCRAPGNRDSNRGLAMALFLALGLALRRRRQS